ncbi:MAG: hypothetical protein WBA88_06230 [Pseudaminobacter sp.]
MTTCACGNCQFFDKQNSTAVKQKDPGSGICRYNPPLPQPDAQAHGVWPVVGKKDWCGHFAATVERFMTVAA